MLYVGTSGYSYKEWKGRFYPAQLPAKDMLHYYASRFQAVELNNTFYRLPQPSMVDNWKAQVPDNFRFSVKASQGITHFRRLKDAAGATRLMLETVCSVRRSFRCSAIPIAAGDEEGPPPPGDVLKESARSHTGSFSA